MANILFICKYNRFRSKVAEAYFKQIAHKEFQAKSAGIIRGQMPLDSTQVKIAKSYGINIRGKPQGLSVELLRWADILVIVADNLSLSLFNNQKRYGKRIIHWKVPDAHHTDIKGIKNRILMIKKHIDNFNKSLEHFD